MHFATFAGSDTEAREPVAELVAVKERERVRDWNEEGGFGVVDVGETAVIPLLDPDNSKVAESR
jgi:N-acyl-phosphatidylethanolamine-hydrolysing phospholipase D